MTNLLVLPTQEYKNDGYSSGQLSDVATHIETNWNSYIKDSTGKYQMFATSDYSSPVVLNSPSDISDARRQAVDYMDTNYQSELHTYDAILVRDSRNFPGATAGLAPGGGPTPFDSRIWFAAGSIDADDCVAYSSFTLSADLETHEVGHLYGGRHPRHEIWGVAEHTVMGNRGNETCSGGTSDYRTRRGDFHSCSVTDIRYYMDYWGLD
ncbi:MULTISPECIES: hypothetical protein [unclassified Haladaptatus]|uniref:hypothetical protein n=1 Tax=unclassified Haladaptatus TaxID=2622732 RepID=UPI002FCE4ABB